MSIARQRRPSASRTHLLGTDLQQSVLSDLHATGLNRSAFTPYGFHSGSPALRSRMGFNGQLREPTGWYHLGNGHRVYNPVLMRFHSPDPLSPFGVGGINPYAYCSGSPVGRVDPSGRSSVALVTVGTSGVLNFIFLYAAFNRAALAAVNRTRQTHVTRVGNTLSFWGALLGAPARFAGYAAAAAQGSPSNSTAWISNIGGIVSQVLTGVGALMQNVAMTRTWMLKANENGQSPWAIARVAFQEASGWNLFLGRKPEVVPGRNADMRLDEQATPQAQANTIRGSSST